MRVILAETNAEYNGVYTCVKFLKRISTLLHSMHVPFEEWSFKLKVYND